MTNTIYIDIGNSTIMISDNEKIFSLNFKEIKKYINKNLKNNKILISCTNKNIYRKITKIKSKNLIVLNSELILSKMNTKLDIDQKELGTDIALILFYFWFEKIKDYIYVSFGTAIFLINVQENKLKDLSIGFNNNLNKKKIISYFKLNNEYNKYKFNNDSSIDSSFNIYMLGLSSYINSESKPTFVSYNNDQNLKFFNINSNFEKLDNLVLKSLKIFVNFL